VHRFPALLAYYNVINRRPGPPEKAYSYTRQPRCWGEANVQIVDDIAGLRRTLTRSRVDAVVGFVALPGTR
jgi:hypothetical protein